MEENNTPKKELSLAAWLGILVALIIGVILVFALLEAVIPKQTVVLEPEVSVEVVEETEQPDPSFCPDCGDALPESFQWGQYCPYCGELIEWENTDE